MTDARSRALGGFRERYGADATSLVCAPGRVNLIGEHIDYCGLPVLPMALRRAVWIAYRPAQDAAVRAATDVPGLEPRTFEARPPIPPAGEGDWSNYVRAAIATVGDAAGRGLDLFVASDVPVAAGLSSSSALVVGTALAWLDANDRRVGDRADLATRLALGERYVGTAGGGMDQAASLLGVPGAAILLEFAPLRARAVAVPAEWRIIVGHSGEVAEKSGAAQALYNRRTREAAEAARTVAAALGAPDGPADRQSAEDPSPADADQYGLALYPGLLSGASRDALLSAAANLAPPLDRRFRHIVTEAVRVREMAAALAADHLESAGRLLLASHASLRDDCEVSTPALDDLVETALEAGAAGARLTGAGLGGCAIAMAAADRAPAVLEAFRSRERRAGGPRIAFVAEPGGGAEILPPD